MGRGTFIAVTAILLGLAACARPEQARPVQTEAEAIAVARGALAKTGYEQAHLTAERDGPAWLVTTPREYRGQDWSQMRVRINSATGKVVMGSFQTSHIDLDLDKPR